MGGNNLKKYRFFYLIIEKIRTEDLLVPCKEIVSSWHIDFTSVSRNQTESKKGFLKMPRSKSIIVDRVEFELNKSINHSLNRSK